MIRVRPVGRLALFLALGGTSPCHAATEEAKAPDYLEWRLLNRNYFLYNDYRRADAGRGYRKEWAHGLIADLESAYTPGRVGFGLDLHGFAGFKLDGGRGHAGTGLLPLDSSGDNASEYSDAGAALKLRLGESLLKVGEMTVETPVFDTSDKRLQPQYARGFFLQSDDLDRVRIQAGRFTAFKEQASSSGHGDFDGYGASTAGSAIGFALLVFFLPCVFLLGGYLIGRLLGLGDGGSIGMAAAGLVLGFVPAVLINRTITRRKTPEFTVLGYLHSV